MVNYRYRAEELVSNHERYASEGRIALSRELERRLRTLHDRRSEDPDAER